MAAAALDMLRSALSGLGPSSDLPAPTKRADAQPAIAELEALNLDLDLVANHPSKAASLVEPLLGSFSAKPISGDHLRLPQLTRLDGPQMRAAMRRVLSVDTHGPAPSERAVISEERMRYVLRALTAAVDHIDQQSRPKG